MEVARLLLPDKTARHGGILLGPQVDTGRPADIRLKGETRGICRGPRKTSSQAGANLRLEGVEMVRPERFERPTYWFVASCSIQLSYGRTSSLANGVRFDCNFSRIVDSSGQINFAVDSCEFLES